MVIGIRQIKETNAKMKSIAEITKNMTDWQPPVIPEDIAHGDMPGDKVEIGE